MDVQIIENENFIKYADFDNCEVWLLNRTSDLSLDERVINVAELTESLLPNSSKLPALLTHIVKAHPNELFTYKSYKVITDNKESYMIHTYICDEQCIKEVEDVGSN